MSRLDDDLEIERSTEIRNNETRAGTKYQIEKWTCPHCHEQKSTLLIDDQWCHGDVLAASFYNGESCSGCVKCTMEISAKHEAPDNAAQEKP